MPQAVGPQARGLLSDAACQVLSFWRGCAAAVLQWPLPEVAMYVQVWWVGSIPEGSQQL